MSYVFNVRREFVGKRKFNTIYNKGYDIHRRAYYTIGSDRKTKTKGKFKFKLL